MLTASWPVIDCVVRPAIRPTLGPIAVVRWPRFSGVPGPLGCRISGPSAGADLVRRMSSGREIMRDVGLSSRVSDGARFPSFRTGVCWRSPPRTRGNLGLKSQLEGVVRNTPENAGQLLPDGQSLRASRCTPAAAGQPWVLVFLSPVTTVHPRGCGAI